MKNVIKLSSILFLVGGLLFLSCDKKPSGGSTTTSTVGGDGPVPGTTGEVKVTFGSTTWTAGYVEFYEGGGEIKIMACKDEDNESPPAIYFCANSSGTTTYNKQGDDDTYDSDEFMYYENEEHFLFYDGYEDEMYGDWWALSGTVKITSNTSGKISGTASLVMMNAYQYYIDENVNAEKRNLSVTFTNVSEKSLKSLANKFLKSKTKMPSNIKLVKKSK
jgi:hypothetical protein